MKEKEKLIDRTSVVLTDDLKTVISRRANANERSFSDQLRRDLKTYYRLITEGEKQ
jgi:hypothetical protein